MKPPYACGQPLDEVLCSKGTDHKAKRHLRWVTIAVPALAAGDATHLDKTKVQGRRATDIRNGLCRCGGTALDAAKLQAAHAVRAFCAHSASCSEPYHELISLR